ncbi:MAG: hypothetical protein HMLKMBBP_01517 [Planctomycetes bacterium]|nr:hypothetical protein [Planctomycetota bacterium]
MAARKSSKDEFELRFYVDEATFKALSMLAHRTDRSVNGFAKSLVRRGVWGESRLLDADQAKEGFGKNSDDGDLTGEFER